MGFKQLNFDYASHYQAVYTALCGENILVYWDGKKPEKTQLDIHKEKCYKCQKLKK